MTISFVGKVAIVTGAGGGLGRCHALELARRGAKVVINDLGGALYGSGGNSAAAEKVVAEIIAAGGEAIANGASVTDDAGVANLVKQTMDAFGRIDILINNAGFLRDVGFHNMTEADWTDIYQVHLFGAFKVTHAAWPILRDSRYGRVINTSSAAGIYGNFGQVNYSTAKLGLHGFTQALAVEGRPRGIHVNTIAPAADSRLTRTVMTPEQLKNVQPDRVSPLDAWLCHESCNETGGLFESGGGWNAKLQWVRTKGTRVGAGEAFGPEAVRDAWGAITDFSEASNPGDFASSMAPLTEIMGNG